MIKFILDKVERYQIYKSVFQTLREETYLDDIGIKLILDAYDIKRYIKIAPDCWKHMNKYQVLDALNITKKDLKDII